MSYLSKICLANTTFLNHLVDLDLGAEVFFKREGEKEKGRVDFETGN